MKGTKEKAFYKIFTNSKFTEEGLEKDKEKIIAKYTTLGYRDAIFTGDSIEKHDEKQLICI